MWSSLKLQMAQDFGEMLESLGHMAISLNPQWKFGIPAAKYVEGTATLASSMY